jgi:4-hydroxy-tetrahydrodipicolinate synthase
MGMFTGSCVALVTPMTQDGTLDKESAGRLIDWHLEQGTDAIVIGGTTGEGSTLDAKEWDILLELAISKAKEAKRPIPVIAGTGTNSTEKTIKDTKRAKKLGCDGALIVTPYYNKPTQEGLHLHYQKIAEAVDLPLILYNVPHRTACDLSPELAIKLSYIPNIVGIKDATGDLARIALHQKDMNAAFKLYTGDDQSAMAFMTLGGSGVISVAANVVPKAMHDLCAAVFSSDLIKANTINQSLKRLYQNLFVESNPIPVKWALHKMGLITEGIRLPLTPLSKSYHAPLLDELHNLGLLENVGEGA